MFVEVYLDSPESSVELQDPDNFREFKIVVHGTESDGDGRLAEVLRPHV